MSDEQITFGEAGIDVNAEPVQGNFELLPKGKYKAQITKIGVFKKESGSVMVDLEGEILSEPYLNRKVWTSINIVKKDGTVNAIGNGQISALAKACGKSEIPNNEQVLLGIPHIVSINIEKNEDPQYADKNKMVAFYPLSDKNQAVKEKIEKHFDARVPEKDDDSLPF